MQIVVLLQLHYVDRMVNYTLILFPDLIRKDENCSYVGCNNMCKKTWTTMKLHAESSSNTLVTNYQSRVYHIQQA